MIKRFSEWEVYLLSDGTKKEINVTDGETLDDYSNAVLVTKYFYAEQH